jgi:hypothetical protein
MKAALSYDEWKPAHPQAAMKYISQGSIALGNRALADRNGKI